jgi:hypothetical protein
METTIFLEGVDWRFPRCAGGVPLKEEGADGEVSEKRHWEEAVQLRTPTPDGQNWLFGAARGRPGRKIRTPTAHAEAVWLYTSNCPEPKVEIPVRRLWRTGSASGA